MGNLAYYQSLMAGIRAAIGVGSFADFREQVFADWREGDVSTSADSAP